MPYKYPLPDFLNGILTQQAYKKWLDRKAVTHKRRDCKRGNKIATNSLYKRAIHEAVLDSLGKDFYTGEQLIWTLLSKYNNVESKKHRRAYKAKFALLPSVDHVDDGLGAANFKICAWRTNDAKNDLSHDDFVALCLRVASHHKNRK
ncbi:MAG: hypothetical protein HY053_05710 [Proteobacteria bacterium]|nr:hypothetical protein [Pseudomonadota bacterium]